MKYFIEFFCLTVSLICAAQEKNMTCDTLKYDTLRRSFTIELNSKFLFYTELDAILQDGLMFENDNQSKKRFPCYQTTLCR
jgi:hypothetical protein